ncbi:AtpZ/AtpI family protein [Pararhizobium gei]|uniref:AtpZ/AtpI family protein n=1 Tax=Pararhizobium gei TaxID=1395951 RepID=UPI0023DC468C|nr:AtpZ/AtpI family protein [Rhizobium gei]
MTDNRNDGLEDRLKRLGSELSDMRKEDPRYAADEARAAENRKGYRVAVKLSSEFVAAIIVGALLGYLLDHFAGTGPWGMIVLLLLGFCAGVLNVLRSAGMVAAPHPADRVGRTGNDKNDAA